MTLDNFVLGGHAIHAVDLTTASSSSESEKSTSMTSVDNYDMITSTPINGSEQQRQQGACRITSKLKKSIDNYENMLDAPYRGKALYGKEWLFQTIYNHAVQEQQQQQQTPIILTLIGDSGSGKTHICCELKWPTAQQDYNLSPMIICAYFLNIYLNKRTLIDFYQYLKSAIIYHTILDNNDQAVNWRQSNLNDTNDELSMMNEYDVDEPNVLADKFITHVLRPLPSLLTNNKNYFILIDGIDEALLQDSIIKTKCTSEPFNTTNSTAINMHLIDQVYKKSQTNSVLVFLNRIFKSFPSWLNLILTCKRANEKKLFNNNNSLFNLSHAMTRYQIGVDMLPIPIHIQSANYNSSILTGAHTNMVTYNDRADMSTRSSTMNSGTSSSSSSTTSTSSSGSKSSSIDITTDYHTDGTRTPSSSTTTARNMSTFKDIQVYILKRLDNDYELKSKFNKLNAIDMLNLLLIKSNYCVLYVEKIFDLILLNLINSREIKDIPVTLYGLYLFLIERICNDLDFVAATPDSATLMLSNDDDDDDRGLVSAENGAQQQPSKKELLFSIFNILMTTLKPTNKTKLYGLLKLRYLNLNFGFYDDLMSLITPILFRTYRGNNNNNDQYVLYHTSFIEWFTDVKFCTAKYLFNVNEGHFIMSLHYLKALRLKQLDWELKKSHVVASDPQNPTVFKTNKDNDSDDDRNGLMIAKFKLNLFNSPPFITAIEFNYLHSFISVFNDCFSVANRVYDTSVRTNQTDLFDCITKGDLAEIKLLVDVDGVKLYNRVTDVHSKQTALIIATKANNLEVLRYLAKLPHIDLDHCDNEGWTALRYAAWMGNESIVQVLLQCGAHVDACDADGRTALRAAVYANNLNIVRMLVENYGANVNKCDADNRSVLQIACLMGHMDIIQYLIRNGKADINHKDQYKRNILSMCITNKATALQPFSFELIKLLIDNNADLTNCDLNNQNALIHAVKAELNDAIILLLLNSNVDIDQIDNDGNTAIAYAIQMNASKIVEILLEYDAATHILDKEGRSLLSLACSYQCDAVVRMLMDRGLDEMHRDNHGWTPLHEATYSGNENIVSMLLNYGSNLNDLSDNEGKTSLYYACQEGHLAIVQMLVDNGASIEQRAHDGNSPFRIACLQGYQDICEYLFDKNISIDYKDPDGRTTLYCMVLLSKKIEIIEYLLAHGANVNERDADGRSCLHIAAHVGNIDVVRMLMKYKANTAITDNGGRTPLLIASWNDKIDVVKELLNNANTDPNHRDCQGATALSIASQKGNYDILNELLVHGAMINRSSKNPIKLALRGAFNNCVELLKNNLVLQQAVVAPTPPRNSRSFDSFRFVASNNNERKILSTLHEANNRMQQQRANAGAGGGLHSSLSMSNHFKMMPNVDDTLKSICYIEPSYRILQNTNKKPNPSISDDQNSMRIDASSTDHLPKQAKTFTNNKILQILRKKFRIFRPTSKKQMTRSVTDATLTPTVNVSLQGLHDTDDTAHIFKRTSLNGYFIKNNSIKQYQMEEADEVQDDDDEQAKFPIPSGFKKETSI